MLLRTLSLLMFVVFASTMHAQTPTYKAMMYDMRFNFYEVCDSAEAYFSRIDKTVKGSGYKPYMRWREENESKYYPSGDRMTVDHYMPAKEYARLLEEKEQQVEERLFTDGIWQSLGPANMGTITGHYAAGLGRVEYVEVNRNNAQQIYMGSRSGGLWRTSNGGNTWVQNTDFLPASGVNAIAANPSNFDEVLINVRIASLGNSFGIYRSMDGGATFTQSGFNPAALGFGGLGSDFKIYVIKYHPRVANLVFVGTDRGVFRSTNNLSSWVRLNNSWNVQDIEFHPTDDNIIYLYENYYWGSNKNKIFKSTNQGVSYTALSDLSGNGDAEINISVSATCASCIFASSDNGIWKSFDGGGSFSTTVNPAPTDVSLWYTTPNDTDTSKFVGGYGDLYRSSNGGSSFTKATWWYLGAGEHGGGSYQTAFTNSQVYVHADCNYMTCVNGIFYACTDGFLCKSTDNGLTWQKLSLSTGIRENYNLGVSQSNQARTICGSQDNGTSIKNEGGWTEYYGADGMEGIIHPLNDDWMIGSWQNGGRIKTTNGGLSNDAFTPSGQTGATWIAPMFYDPNDHMTVYSIGNNVHKSTDFGTTWTTLGSPSAILGGAARYGSIAENNSNIIVLVRDEKIALSTDGGSTFTNIKSNLPDHSITDVVFDPRNDARIIVVNDSYQNNGQKVYITNNSGASWDNITYNLGNMPIESVIIDHSAESNIYLGAAIGVYTKSMAGSSWTLHGSSLPNVTVKELDIMYGSNTLRAASWGRGLFEYSLAGKNNYPAIVKTSITSPVTLESPKATVPQYVTSNIDGNPTSAYVRWSINTPDFIPANQIAMTLQGGNTWVSNSPIPDFPAGTKVFFKVYAENGFGVTETYKFMYKLIPYAYCAAAGESSNGNLYMTSFSCANVTKTASSNVAYNNYTSPTDTIVLTKGSTYTASGNFNTGWSSNDFRVWVDYNKDATFTATEVVASDADTGNSGTGTFTVPATASAAATRMRVRLGYWGGWDDPCGTTLGVVADFPVRIMPNAALPIELLRFDATPKANHVLLAWATASELNHEHFTIERSHNATQWHALGNVNSLGNSSDIQDYSFRDESPLRGVSYYRLMSTDRDGKTSYSEIKTVNFNDKSTRYQIFPNPVDAILHVRSESEEAFNYRIVNHLGQVVQEGNTTTDVPVSIATLPSGMYMMLLEDSTLKFIKK